MCVHLHVPTPGLKVGESCAGVHKGHCILESVCERDSICRKSLRDFFLSCISSLPPSNVSLAGAATSIVFVATKIFCRDRHYFVATKTCLYNKTTKLPQVSFLSRQKYFVATDIILSRQRHVCIIKRQSFVATSIQLLRQKTFLATKHLSRQKWYLWQLPPRIATDIPPHFSFPFRHLFRPPSVFFPSLYFLLLTTQRITGGSCHKYNFCRDKTCVCRDKTRVCRDKSKLVATKLF